MPLNETLEWAEVGMLETNVVGDVVLGRVREAFKGYQADKKLIKQGTKLYKFNSYRSLAKSEQLSEPVSPWWSPYFPYEHDPGWAEKKRLAQHMGVSVREWGRLTSAVREDWNSLVWLLIVTFNVDVCGWFGGFSQMPRIGERPSMRKPGEGAYGMSLPGGGTQFYIPNLVVGHVATTDFEDLNNQ